MQHRDFDVVVVGGGLAGSLCAARLADQGLQVALVERSSFNQARVGEVIAVPVLRWLCQLLGLAWESCESVIYRYATFVVNWGDRTGVHSHIGIHSTANVSHCVVNRRALDLLLFQHASKFGVDTWQDAKLSKVVRQLGRWSFSLSNQQAVIGATAKLAIEATGRTTYSPFSVTRGRMFQDKAIACSLRFETSVHSNNQIIIESAPDGWWYSCQLSDTESLIAFFTDRDLLPKGVDVRHAWLEDKLRSSQLLGDYTRSLMNNKTGWVRSDARMSIRRQCSGDGWLAVGDAQMALDPLSGHGMLEATRSAIDSVPFVRNALSDSAFEHQAFANNIASRYNDQLKKRAWTYRAEQKWPDSQFWIQRHGWKS